jgi:hypothetical protein
MLVLLLLAACAGAFLTPNASPTSSWSEEQLICPTSYDDVTHAFLDAVAMLPKEAKLRTYLARTPRLASERMVAVLNLHIYQHWRSEERATRSGLLPVNTAHAAAALAALADTPEWRALTKEERALVAWL